MLFFLLREAAVTVVVQKYLLILKYFYLMYLFVCFFLCFLMQLFRRRKENSHVIKNCRFESFFLRAEGLFVGFSIDSFAPGS